MLKGLNPFWRTMKNLPGLPDDDFARKEAKRMLDQLNPLAGDATDWQKQLAMQFSGQAGIEEAARQHASIVGKVSPASEMDRQMKEAIQRHNSDALAFGQPLGKGSTPEADAKSYLESLQKRHDEQEDQAEKMRQRIALDNGRQTMRHLQAHQARADELMDYQRRTAEASEGALKAAVDAERVRTAEAKADAANARKAQKKAESYTRISLVIAFASLLVAAWPFIKEQF